MFDVISGSYPHGEWAGYDWTLLAFCADVPHIQKKTRATNEPECSHVKHLCEANSFNNFVHFSSATVPV